MNTKEIIKFFWLPTLIVTLTIILQLILKQNDPYIPVIVLVIVISVLSFIRKGEVMETVRTGLYIYCGVCCLLKALNCTILDMEKLINIFSMYIAFDSARSIYCNSQKAPPKSDLHTYKVTIQDTLSHQTTYYTYLVKEVSQPKD